MNAWATRPPIRRWRWSWPPASRDLVAEDAPGQPIRNKITRPDGPGYRTASRSDIVGLYQRVWEHSDATIDAQPLDALGQVPWWPPERRQVTLHLVLVHMIAETERHAGHADIVRETIDGAAGLRPEASNLPEADERWWADYRGRLEQVAKQFA